MGDDDALTLAYELTSSSLEYDDALAWVRKVQANAIRDAARAMPVYGRRGEPRTYDPSGDEDVVDFLNEYADGIEESVQLPQTCAAAKVIEGTVLTCDLGVRRHPTKHRDPFRGSWL